MRKILLALLAGGMIGALIANTGAQAKLPPAPPKSEAQKKAEADKAAAGKAKEAADLSKAQDRAVANYKKNHAAMGKK